MVLVVIGTFACSACAPLFQPPAARGDPFADIELIGYAELAEPVPNPPFHRIEPVEVDGELVGGRLLEAGTDAELAELTPEGVVWLRRLQIAATTNERTAAVQTSALREAHGEIDQLKIAGQAEHARAELTAELLEIERRARWFERIGYWAGMILFGAAAIAD